MNIDDDELAIHDIPDTTVIEMESKYFNEIIKDCLEIDEVLNIVIKNDNNEDGKADESDEADDNICFICEGDLTSLNMVIHKDDITYDNLQNLNSKYSLSHINTFSKAFNLSKNVKIEIGDSVPIKFSYKIMDTGYIEYYLAPKYDDDDDI